jgi:arylsulfatase A-like enzyme
MREPCIVRWLGRVPAGRVCSETATTMDLYPTFAHLAGAKLPRGRVIDGRDIWPLMAGEKNARTPHKAFFYYRGGGLWAVRSGKWKLFLDRPKEGERGLREALYDLETDIGETTNVADRHPDVVKRLRGLLEKCRDDLGDTRTKRKGRNVRPAGTL